MYLEGKYLKWTSNGGYINERAEGIEVMEAFQHYTYVKSGRDIICCDLQGVKNKNTFFITDPAVLSKKKIFGDTDMGYQWFNRILARHKCNYLCRILGLFNESYNPKL
jgi:hypothetical protein